MTRPGHVQVPSPIVWAAAVTAVFVIFSAVGLSVWLAQPVCDADCQQQDKGHGNHPEGRCDNADLVLGKRSFKECAEADANARKADRPENRTGQADDKRPLLSIGDGKPAERNENPGEKASNDEPKFHAASSSIEARESIA